MTAKGLTEAEIDALIEVATAATAEPRIAYDCGKCGLVYGTDSLTSVANTNTNSQDEHEKALDVIRADAALISVLPRLLAQVKAQAAEIARLRKPKDSYPWGATGRLGPSNIPSLRRKDGR